MQKNTVPLKYLSILWRTLEISLINCDINLILTWPTNCVIAGVSRITQKLQHFKEMITLFTILSLFQLTL